MNNRMDVDAMVAELVGWVKGLEAQAAGLSAAALEERVREEGRVFLAGLLRGLLGGSVLRQAEAARVCSCGARRHHQGVRPRKLLTTLGEVELHGVYFKCEACGLTGHSIDAVCDERMSEPMTQAVTLMGTALGSFAKAELVSERVLGVKVDEQTIRRTCLREGRAVMRHPPEVVEGDKPVTVSCDGTMVHVRGENWREIKAFRVDHGGGSFGGARLEDAAAFRATLREAVRRSGAGKARDLIALSDAAVWIEHLVRDELPGVPHIVDIYHARQHVHVAAELIYGEHHPFAAKWSRYWSIRLRREGAAKLLKQLRRLALCYTDLDHQRHVLDLARFLERHASRMDYPTYESRRWPISSGPMESLCKQLGLRLKGPGMRWRADSVDPMAALVSRWSLGNWPQKAA